MSARLTDEEIDAIEARANAATEGPWKVGELPDEDSATVCTVAKNEDYEGEPYATSIVESALCEPWANPADLVFIAHARSDIPALIASLRAAGGSVKEGGTT